MTDFIKISPQECEQKVAALFVKEGVKHEIANCVATHLVLAEIDGQSGHGLSRIPSYLGQVKSGKVNGQISPKITKTSPSAINVGVKSGFAYPAIESSIEELGAMAQTQGIAMAILSQSHHAGVLAHHVEKLAKKGLVAMMFANTPAAMAPWGGTKALFGTNPFAFASPRSSESPFVLDMALTKVARGKIVQAKAHGKPIPEGWAFDQSGAPTTDPAIALEGSLAPAGDAKGAALALMVELLCGALAGSHFGFEASSFFDVTGAPPHVGQLIIAIRPQNDNFTKRAETLFSAILEQDGTRLSGSGRDARRLDAQTQGIKISKEMAQILAIS